MWSWARKLFGMGGATAPVRPARRFVKTSRFVIDDQEITETLSYETDSAPGEALREWERLLELHEAKAQKGSK